MKRVDEMTTLQLLEVIAEEPEAAPVPVINEFAWREQDALDAYAYSVAPTKAEMAWN
jgi:hypothetical protein